MRVLGSLFSLLVSAVGLCSAEQYRQHIVPILQARCAQCHDGRDAKGGFDLRRFRNEAAVAAALGAWESAIELVENGEMPPPKAPALSSAQRSTLLKWYAGLRSKQPKNPGATTLRRLNRTEYDNTIRDLLGVKTRPSEQFPSDNVGHGFDNIGSILSMSPLQFEKYLIAARQMVNRAIAYGSSKNMILAAEMQQRAAPVAPAPQGRRGRRAAGGQTTPAPTAPPRAKPKAEPTSAIAARKAREAGRRTIQDDSRLVTQVFFPVSGSYSLSVRAGAEHAGKEPVFMIVKLRGRTLGELILKGRHGTLRSYTLRAKEQRRGLADIEVLFANPAEVDGRKRALILESIEIRAPRSRTPTGGGRRLITVKPSRSVPAREAAKKNLEPFIKQAYRRPVSAVELEQVLKVYDAALAQGLPFEDGMKQAFQAVLLSPKFLFRVELDGRPRQSRQGPAFALDDWELASRLSYFLWCSMPDKTLFTLAESGELRQEESLQAQAARMLSDRKADGFIESFTRQWLHLQALDEFQADPDLFPTYNEALKNDMQAEAMAFVRHVIREDRSIIDLLDADYTFVNSRLATHYGLSGVTGVRMQQVPVRDGKRGGILSLGAVLTLTSNPNRTSPAKRGKFVLEQLLGDPPPPPPPNVEGLAEDKVTKRATTLRELLEQHRNKPDCVRCHEKLDPIGFGLEHYDAIGRWRDREGRNRIDSAGTLPSGESFAGPPAMKKVFAKAKREQFARCLTEKLLTFALGRKLEPYDKPTIDAIVKDLDQNDYRFSVLIDGIVTSYPFRYRRP